MKPSIQVLGQILYAPAQYVIPVFQRNYRWERPQWEKLWESLEEIQSPEKRGNHFMGFLVFVPGLPQPGQNTAFHLIDGQQRLTTCSILLAAIRNVARRQGFEELAQEIHSYYLVHPLKKGQQHYRLLPKERDHDAYISIIESKAAQGRVADAASFFEEQCQAVAESGEEGLRVLFNVVSQRLEFMCATLEAENAYNIFKSLNSTGVPLGQADLIRNFVFMHVPPDDQDEFDRSHWSPLEDRFTKPDGSFDEGSFSAFFRDYLMSAGKYVSPKDTFSAFEARYEATKFSPHDLADRLIQASRRYAIISGRDVDASGPVTTALKKLNQLESSTTYPLLLALFAKRDASEIGDEGLARAIDMLSGFILRRFVCGESSRGYGQMFVRALGEGRNEPVAALEKYLLERGWPDDRKFTHAFVQFPIYERRYARAVLEALERGRGHKEPADLQNAEIEHVMPQTLNDEWRQSLGPSAERIHADWLHCPGNLTLSGYNLELWNHAFAVKRERYSDSNITLTRELATYNEWGQHEIAARGRKMAGEALAIWIGPKDHLPQVMPEPQATRFELRSKFWAGLQNHLESVAVDLPRIEPTKYMHTGIDCGVRNVGMRLRYSLNGSSVAIVLWFVGTRALGVWEAIRSGPADYDSMVGARWEFGEVGGRPRARMRIEQTGLRLRDEKEWVKAYDWFATKLPLVYERVLPSLADRLGTRANRNQRAPTDVEACSVMNEICPDAVERRVVLRQLLESIEVAHQVGSNSYSVTLFDEGFRLNVGQVEALTLGRDFIRVLVHGEPEGAIASAGQISRVPYANAPQPSYAIALPISDFAVLRAALEEGHRSYIMGAAQTADGRPRRSSFRRHHSEELVAYARECTAKSESA